MWKQQQQMESQQFAEYSDKYCMDSAGDSGFLSSDFTSSTEFSSSSISGDVQSSCSKSSRATDNGIDFGLSSSFDQLSLKNAALNQLDSCKSATMNDSGIISMTDSLDNVEGNCQESWQLYYTQNEDGDTLLHTAIIQGFLEASLSLINMAPHPSLLDILNDDSQTALHLAVLTDQPIIVRRLVLAGADLSLRNYQGNTALHLASISGSLDCAKALTEPLAVHEGSFLSSQRLPTQNFEQRNYHGQTCLHAAATKNHVELVKLLVRRGADIEAQESLAGRTALHLALELGCLDVFCYLLHECRPDLDAATYSGCTAYQIASCVDEKLARELVRLGATPIDADDDFRESSAYFGAAATRA